MYRKKNKKYYVVSTVSAELKEEDILSFVVSWNEVNVMLVGSVWTVESVVAKVDSFVWSVVLVELFVIRESEVEVTKSVVDKVEEMVVSWVSVFVESVAISVDLVSLKILK